MRIIFLTFTCLILVISNSIAQEKNNYFTNVQESIEKEDISMELKLRYINRISAEGKSYKWKKSSLKKQGIDHKIIYQVYDSINQLKYINSLVIIKNGYLVSEKYYNVGNKDVMDLTFSVTKSVISTLIGIAIDKGFIQSVEDKMLSFFPEIDTNHIDPRKKEITIKHLLAMQAGFGEEKDLQAIVDIAINEVNAIIKSDLHFNPGTDFLYSSHGSHILSVIITKSVGMNTSEFANEYLFKPLGMKEFIWVEDKNGIPSGGGGLMLTPRDMARIGYLYEQNGIINEKRILSENWIKESTSNKRSNLYKWNDIVNLGYGYQWWTGELNNESFYAAIGHAGQWILIVPNINLIIAVTMDPRTEKDSQQMSSIIPLLSLIILANS